MRSSPTRWRARSGRPPHARASWPQRVRTDPTDAEELMSAIALVVETLLSLALFVALARLLLQWTRADFRNPLCQAVVRITNPLILPLRRVLPPIGKLDTASVIAEAVSSLPMGGSTRRSGRMSGLVMRTTAWQSGLRKSARVHCSSSRARATNNARDSSVSTTKAIALMSSSASVGSVRTRCGQLARACGGRPERARHRVGELRILEHAQRRFGSAARGGHLGAQPREIAVPGSCEQPGAVERDGRQ